MRAKNLYNPAEQIKIRTTDINNLLLAQRLITDLGGILNKNSIDGLVRSAQKLVKSVTETSSKIR